jgi:phospholipid N-methyltransferase
MLNQQSHSHWYFLKHFLRNPLQVGAVVPSSQELARKISEDLDLQPGEVVIELGPGTGALTREICKKLPDASSYLGIECEPRFVTMLRRQYRDLLIMQGRAERAAELHRHSGLGPVKAIISGIPFANMWSQETREEMMKMLDEFMKNGCVFRTFQYVHAYTFPPAVRFRKDMNQRYGKCKRSKIIFKNFPPAYVLTWQTSKHEAADNPFS